MRSSTCIMSFCSAGPQSISVRFLSLGSIHFILRRASLDIHEFSSIGFWQPTNCASYSLPFLPLTARDELLDLPGLLADELLLLLGQLEEVL